MTDYIHFAFFEAFPNTTKLSLDESRCIFSFDYRV